MSASQNTVASAPAGKLEGTFEDGIFVFRGVPYAAPPTGRRRWRAPEALKPWDGVRPALRSGTIPPQGMSSVLAFREPVAEEPQSEDCLFLNIWTPGLDKRKRPVMVWIHGGAFTRGAGSSARQTSEKLAKRGDAVIVNVNYRLGPLGFLRLKEATNGVIPSTGNEGLLDQIAALRWIKNNIEAFGGDPENVTLFGESAGAMSIGALMAMPAAKGLFQKAILQSGASTYRTRDESIRVGEYFIKKLGLSGKDTDALLALPPETLINVPMTAQELGAQDNMPGLRGALMSPVVDGDTMPDIPLDAIQKGAAKDISVITGSNLDEAKLFGAMSPAMQKLTEDGLQKRAIKLLPPELAVETIRKYQNFRQKRGQDASPGEILMAIQTDQQFRIPVVRVAEIQSRLGAKAYNYLFTWESPTPGLGACHALDVGFVFGTMDKNFNGVGAEADKLSASMQDGWISFARYGDPSCTNLGRWAVYDKQRETMVLNKKCRMENAPFEEERRIWDNVPNSLLG